MALGDMMALRLSHSSASVSSHLDEYSGREDGESQRKDSEASTLGNSATATSMSYLPHTLVLCELRHEGFEAFVSSGPPECGPVSKWRPKDRVNLYPRLRFLNMPFIINIGVHISLLSDHLVIRTL